MRHDVVDLKSFYARPLGSVVRAMILRRVRARWETLTGLALLGLGYGAPYLDSLRLGAERAIAFNPARQGASFWPLEALSASALIDPEEMPLRDAVFDRVLMVHCLETAEDPAAFLGEVWRILAPGGHVIMVVPNRRGAWAQNDTTPFGQGQPFSRHQLTELMRGALFTPIHWGEALYMPPIERAIILRTAEFWERAGGMLPLPFAGVHVIEATKQVWRPALARKVSRVRAMLEPILVPEGSTARKDCERLGPGSSGLLT
jgi:SAM-dependent methyltransferase